MAFRTPSVADWRRRGRRVPPRAGRSVPVGSDTLQPDDHDRTRLHSDRSVRAGRPLPARRAGPRHGWVRDRHHRVRHHGPDPRGRRRRRRLHPERRPRDLRLRARRRGGRTGPRLLRRPLAPPWAAGGPDDGVRRVQRAQRSGDQLRDAAGVPVPRRPAARRLLRRRLAGRRQPGAGGPQGPGRRAGDDRPLRRERGRRARRHLDGPAPGVALGVLGRGPARAGDRRDGAGLRAVGPGRPRGDRDRASCGRSRTSRSG